MYEIKSDIVLCISRDKFPSNYDINSVYVTKYQKSQNTSLKQKKVVTKNKAHYNHILI